MSSELYKWGMVKQIENIGEAIYKISGETKKEFTELDWTALAGTRHVYVHDYFKLNWERVWRLLQTTDFEELPASVSAIRSILIDRYSLS